MRATPAGPASRGDGVEELVLERSGLAVSISVLHADGRRQYRVSPGFTELTGYVSADLERHGYDILAGPLTDPDALERAVAVRREGGVLELVLHRADGSPFWDRMSISFAQGMGSPTWVVLHEDVTDDEGGRADLVERLRRTERRGELLSQVFEDISEITDRQESFARILALAVPEFADWAWIFKHGGGGHGGAGIVAAAGGPPDGFDAVGPPRETISAGDFFEVLTRHSPDDILVPRITEEWLSEILSVPDYPVVRQLIGASLIAVPIRGLGASFGGFVQVTYGLRPYDREDFETAKVIGSRLGVMLENLEWSTADNARVETLETAVFAPPPQFPGLDVAVEVGPPLPSDPYVNWCDAFPLADDMEGFVISQVYATGMAAAENVAMQRAAIKALLWNDPSPRAALADIARFTYATYLDPLAASGQIATIRPDGSDVVLEIASVAHQPALVREPGRGFRVLTGTGSGTLGQAGIPMVASRERLARGSVVFFLSDAALGGMSGPELNEMDNLIAALKVLPEQAHAADYAEVIRDQAARTMWKRRLCFLVVRVPTVDWRVRTARIANHPRRTPRAPTPPDVGRTA